jgi:hypothetical protein
MSKTKCPELSDELAYIKNLSFTLVSIRYVETVQIRCDMVFAAASGDQA